MPSWRRNTLPPDFRNIDTHKARVVLIEAGPRVLAGFADDLSAYAQRSLESIGVEVKLGQAVTECTADSVVYGGKPAGYQNIIWAAGVRGRRRRVARTHRLNRAAPAGPARPHGANHPDIFAIGDTVAINGPDGKPVPALRRPPSNRDAMSRIPSRRACAAARHRSVPIPACRQPWRRSASARR